MPALCPGIGGRTFPESSGRNLTLSLVHPRLGWGENFGQRVTGHTPGRIDRNGTVSLASGWLTALRCDGCDARAILSMQTEISFENYLRNP